MANNHNLIKKTRGIIKQVINKSKCSKISSEFYRNGSILNDKISIANAFNDYFVNIGPTLASQIPGLSINYRNFMPEQNKMSFFLSPTEESEVKKIIAELKDGAPGIDEIMSKSLKCISDHVAIPLTRLINLGSVKLAGHSPFAIRHSMANVKSLTFDVWSYLAIQIQLFIFWRGKGHAEFFWRATSFCAK